MTNPPKLLDMVKRRNRHVLQFELKGDIKSIRASRSKHLPVVLIKAEINSLISSETGTKRLVIEMLYGTGLRMIYAHVMDTHLNVKSPLETHLELPHCVAERVG